MTVGMDSFTDSRQISRSDIVDTGRRRPPSVDRRGEASGRRREFFWATAGIGDSTPARANSPLDKT